MSKKKSEPMMQPEKPETAATGQGNSSSENTAHQPGPESLEHILASARELGVEMDEAEARFWLEAMTTPQEEEEISVDVERGIFGHKVAMLDFSPRELARFRQIGKLVGFENQPGVVETALALSGSSAQSKIQTYPGDADFFERVNILADSREQACAILARLMRDKALGTLKGPTYQLIEVKFGTYPYEVLREGDTIEAGIPISWTPEEIQAGKVQAVQPDGSPAEVVWEDVACDPGWCKLDWVVADPLRGKLANVSNMLDVTWEAPDGSIIPLDGYLDPYFQEVYLETEAIPIFSKLVQHVSGDALENYINQLEGEVKKYLTGSHLNYGKAAKRMYNIFRLTGRYHEAAYLRQIFDEPAGMLYQVWSLIRTIDEATLPETPIAIDDVCTQADELIVNTFLSSKEAFEGDQRVDIVRPLLRLRQALEQQQVGQALSGEAHAAREQVIEIVNRFFYERLVAEEGIRLYMESMTIDG